MEELNIKTKIYTDENIFTIICKETKDYWDCYLIFNKTKKCNYIGCYNEEDLPKLDKIGENLLLWYENDMLLTIINEIYGKDEK